jgi:hypothetical protein
MFPLPHPAPDPQLMSPFFCSTGRRRTFFRFLIAGAIRPPRLRRLQGRVPSRQQVLVLSVDGHRSCLPGRRGGYPPRPPQIRKCPIRAYGSSCESFVPSGVAVSDPGRWQWVPGKERVEFVPEELLSSRSPFQPLVPSPHDLEAICLEPPNIPRDTEVGKVTIECRRQPSVRSPDLVKFQGLCADTNS